MRGAYAVIPAAAKRRAGTATSATFPAVPDRRATRLSGMTVGKSLS
jgi:hypothetical protein